MGKDEIKELSLPEWAFLTGGDYKDFDALTERNAIVHLTTGSIFEVVDPTETVIKPTTPQMIFKLYDGYKMLCAIHKSNVPREDMMQELRECTQWYDAYCRWEDEKLANEPDETISLN
jgi:hypothetical protein